MSSLPYISEVICSSRKLYFERREMDNAKLINELHIRSSLWDQGCYDYGNRPLKVQHWEEVASEMKQSVPEVKSRWKLLKDSFNREIRNMARGGNTLTKWIHFDQMLFLLKGTNYGNFETECDSGYLSQSISEMDSEGQNKDCAENELSQTSFITAEDIAFISPKKKKCKTYHTSSSAELSIPVSLNTSDEKRDTIFSLISDPDNEDYLFLTSLLPTLKKLSPKKKMLLKIKFMQNLFEAAFEDDTSTANSDDANSCTS